MTFVIENQIISGLPSKPLTAKRYIIAHESGNVKNCGSDSLDRELFFMKRNCKNAFVSHWVGGGGRIVQLAPVNRVQYGCGPKGNPYCYAQVEMARTHDRATFEKDYAAYIWLLRKLAKDAGLPITLDAGGSGIKSHRWITKNLGGTDHVDPYGYLASFGISEVQFKKDIENRLEGDLTVGQYEELNNKIANLEKQLSRKVNVNSTAAVYADHKEAYDWAKELGLTDGSNPTGALTRQQFFTVLKRYHDTFILNKGEVSASHKELWVKIISQGITDGSNPRALATREQVGTMIHRALTNMPQIFNLDK